MEDYRGLTKDTYVDVNANTYRVHNGIEHCKLKSLNAEILRTCGKLSFLSLSLSLENNILFLYPINKIVFNIRNLYDNGTTLKLFNSNIKH